MKFIHYIEKVSGVDMIGLMSLIVFFAFFTCMFIWVFKTKKSDYNDVSRLPLDNRN